MLIVKGHASQPLVLEAPKQIIVGSHVFRPFPASLSHIRCLHATDDGSDYTADKFVQYFEEIIKRTIKSLSPKMLATLSAYEAYRDPHLIPKASDLPFENMFNTQLSANLTRIDALCSIGRARTARANKQFLETCQFHKAGLQSMLREPLSHSRVFLMGY